MARIFTFDKTIIYIHEPNFYAHEKKTKQKKTQKRNQKRKKVLRFYDFNQRRPNENWMS